MFTLLPLFWNEKKNVGHYFLSNLRTFTTAVRVVGTRIPREMTLFSRPIASTACVFFPPFCINFGTPPERKRKIQEKHILQQVSRQKPAQTNHTKPQNSPLEKKSLLVGNLGYLWSQNRYPEEYEAHVHILLTNNFVQVYQASLGWVEGDKSVCSARLIYLPPLFWLTSLNYETPRGYI
jgi:hypothetical protein